MSSSYRRINRCYKPLSYLLSSFIIIIRERGKCVTSFVNRPAHKGVNLIENTKGGIAYVFTEGALQGRAFLQYR